MTSQSRKCRKSALVPRIDHYPLPRKIPLVLNRVFLLVGIMAAVTPLRGQDNVPVKMTPELALTFPVTQSGHDVTVKYPVIVNPTTILKPGMVLRVLYILSNNSDSTTDLVLAHKGNMEQSYSRETTSPEQSKMPPELAHEIEGYRRTVWQVPNNFILAMAQYPTDFMHLIYSPTGSDRDMTDEKFSFFEGLLIGLPDGKVTVLAVENGSKADKAGIKAGDEIVAVGGASPRNDLVLFATAWANAKKTAKYNNAPSFSMTLRSEGKTDTHAVTIAMPPTIKSSLMDGF